MQNEKQRLQKLAGVLLKENINEATAPEWVYNDPTWMDEDNIEDLFDGGVNLGEWTFSYMMNGMQTMTIGNLTKHRVGF